MEVLVVANSAATRETRVCREQLAGRRPGRGTDHGDPVILAQELAPPEDVLPEIPRQVHVMMVELNGAQ